MAKGYTPVDNTTVKNEEKRKKIHNTTEGTKYDLPTTEGTAKENSDDFGKYNPIHDQGDEKAKGFFEGLIKSNLKENPAVKNETIKMEGKNTLEGTKYVPAAVKKIARNISDYRPVIFTVMGDAPYGKKERQRDMKSTNIDCKSEAYSSAAAMFKESRRPFYIVPGDNDWYDCDKPMDAWNLWKESFLNFDNNWNKNYE
eukprot:15338194-Ditylum_brightwellii.AAC.1